MAANELTILSGVILIFAIIQSVFGVGLLVFGTPTVLLLGYPFDKALIFLLPSSLVISTLQIKHGWNELGEFKKNFSIYSIPSVAIGLFLILLLGDKYALGMLVGSMLIISALIRFSSRLTGSIKVFLSKHSKVYMILMGLVHGMTNMGGGLLTIFISFLCKAKDQIRAHIAFGYGIFAITQLSVLFSLGKLDNSIEIFLLPVISAITYGVIGNRIFMATSHLIYYHAMTVLILIFGVALIISSLR